MRTFNYSEIRNQKWDSDILGLIAAIYKEVGKQEMYLKQRPEELEKLVEIAKIQSSSIEFGNTKTSQITTISYTGDLATGAVFTFYVKSDCPYLGLMNIDSGKRIVVNADFESGDVLKICTENRRKSVTLLRRNTGYDYFIHLEAGSEFLQLSNGENRFKVIVGKGNFAAATVKCEYETLSGGV